MSARATSWAWDQDLPAPEKFLLVALAECARPDGLVIGGEAAQSELATMTGAKERTVRGNLAKLEGRELIKRYAQFEAGYRVPDMIKMAVDGVLDLPADIASGGNGRARPSSTTPSEEKGGGDTREQLPGTDLPLDCDIPDEMRRDAAALLKAKKRADGRIVIEREMVIAAVALAEFNRQAGTDYGLGAHLVPLVMRIRERPSADATKHVRVVQSAFRIKWWEHNGSSRRRVTPNVIYGNERVFEQVIQDAVDEAHGKLSPEKRSRFDRKGDAERQDG